MLITKEMASVIFTECLGRYSFSEDVWSENANASELKADMAVVEGMSAYYRELVDKITEYDRKADKNDD